MVVVGVDGCQGGWLAVSLSPDLAPKCGLFIDIASLWAACHRAALILVDIPIGLPEAAPDRACDRAARKLLGPRRASVFPVPCRAAVYAPDYDTAIKINETVTGKKLFRTTWNLIPRIRQVDGLLRGDARARRVIREAHPEVLFWGLNGGRPLAFAKKDRRGEGERLRILGNLYPSAETFFGEQAERLDRKKTGRDDLLDALAAAVTGLLGGKKLKTLPEIPEHDALGLPMEMVYYVPDQ
ncbi:MAG: DUF429 domain-containing protein [Desulfobaccales bacterium]